MRRRQKPIVKKICRRIRSEEGNVLVTAFIFLVILTLIGIFATRTAQMDLQIAANEIPYRQSFYLAEAGLHREAAELGRGSYPVADINSPGKLADHTRADLPGAPHEAFGVAYEFEVRYEGVFLPPAGFSATDFARYDYNVDVTANHVRVESRLYKIGPRVD